MSDTDVVYVTMTWDSGPYGTYYEAEEPKAVPADSYGRKTVPIPRPVWERYQSAAAELGVAETALEAARCTAEEAMERRT